MVPCLCSFLASKTSRLSWVLALGGRGGRRTPSVMNHSSTLGGVAVGLSRKEKHLPDFSSPSAPGDHSSGRGWRAKGGG